MNVVEKFAADEDEPKRLLRNSRLFKDFSSEIIESIIPLLIPCQFDEGNLICLKGDESDCLFIVRRGEVEVSVSSSDGKVIILGTLGDGDVFGEVGLLDKNTRTANVSAKTDVQLYRLNSTDFDTLSKTFGVKEFMALTSYICFLFRRATNSLEETVFLDASVCVARKIRELYEKSGKKEKSFDVSISQETLGKMAGLSRESANKALSRLEDTGLIQRHYKQITVPDIDRFLSSLSESE